MKSLSGLDATFLYLETPETPMHVGSLHLCELPRGFEGSFHGAVQAHLRKRMHLAPLFSRRLAFVPMDLGHPLWVDAGEVDLDFHVREVKGAMTVRQAKAMAARLHAQLIDRERPLWEFHVFEDVKPPRGMAVQGRLAAFYSKIHHAALDGKGGTVLANAVLDLGPIPREVPPARAVQRQADLGIGQMVGAVFSNSLAQIAKLARVLPAAAGSLGAAARGGGSLQLAPRTVFNVGIGSGRSFATASLPLAQCRALARAAGGSLNDMVLWLCSTALRTYLQKHASVPRRSLVAAMPVSLREDGNTELNNQAFLTAVQLGSQFADPLRRMNAIMESTGKVKQALGKLKSVLPTDYPSLLAPWLVGGAGRMLLKTYGSGSIAQRLPAVANLAISNVPGPPVPLYLAGARLLTFHPLSIVLHGLALNITVQSYAGIIDFGLVADSKAVPKLGDLAKALEAAFEEAQLLFEAPLRQAA
jgi:WS/DGAT/MGAT family acyltransferase